MLIVKVNRKTYGCILTAARKKGEFTTTINRERFVFYPNGVATLAGELANVRTVPRMRGIVVENEN